MDNLFAAAIKSGLEDAPGVQRDVGAMLAWLMAARPDTAATALQSARQNLAGDARSLALLTTVEQEAEKLGSGAAERAQLGPVSVTTAGAAERLALLVSVTRETRQLSRFFSSVDAFACASGMTPEVFALASRVQDMLGGNDPLRGLFWRDELIPAVLQFGWQSTELIAAANGLDLPEEWHAAVEWLRPWLGRRSLAPQTGRPSPEDGFLRPRRAGYRPVASHPLILHMLRSRVLSSLDTTETRQFVAWLAGQASQDPETAFSAGTLALEAANEKGVTLSNSGLLQGDNFWIGVTRQALDVILTGSDAGDQVPAAWQGKHARLDELYGSCQVFYQEQLLGAATGGEALLLYGQSRMIEEWKKINSEAQSRAATLLTTSFADLEQSVLQAQESRRRLDALMGNPFCAPWLPKATQMDPPRSLEAGVLVRWSMSCIKPRDLAQALESSWKPLAGDLISRPQSRPTDWLSSLEQFAAWELTRGTWIDKPVVAPTLSDLDLFLLVNSDEFRSPWEEISVSELIAPHLSRVQGWMSNPMQLPKDADFIASLATICWFGVPDARDLLALGRTLTEAIDRDDTLSDEDKKYLEACRIHLAISAALGGESLNQVLSNLPLLGAPEFATLPQKIEGLLKDGRPFAVRAATDISWLMSVRGTAVQNLKTSELTVLNTPKIRGNDLRETARKLLKILDPLLTEAIKSATDGRFQCGLGLALVEKEINLTRVMS